MNLYNPDLYSGVLSYSFKINQSKITKLEKDIVVNKIYENFDLPVIGWSGSNVYYQNIYNFQVEAIEQKIHPRLPKVRVEYYFKY